MGAVSHSTFNNFIYKHTLEQHQPQSLGCVKLYTKKYTGYWVPTSENNNKLVELRCNITLRRAVKLNNQIINNVKQGYLRVESIVNGRRQFGESKIVNMRKIEIMYRKFRVLWAT